MESNLKHFTYIRMMVRIQGLTKGFKYFMVHGENFLKCGKIGRHFFIRQGFIQEKIGSKMDSSQKSDTLKWTLHKNR